MTDQGTQMAVALPAAKTLSDYQKKKSVSFKEAFRLQESFTSAAERKALAWLAMRLPARVNSDHLAVLGFIAMFLAGASYAFARTHRWGLILAIFFLALKATAWTERWRGFAIARGPATVSTSIT